MIKGIDVSKWQGTIDFKKVKENGIDFVIIRCSVGNEIDSFAERNYNEARKNGLFIGFYHYSYATNNKEALKEAEVTESFLKNKTFELPVFLDIEDVKQKDLDIDTITNIVNNYCIYLENHRYFVGIYSMKSWFTTKLKNVANRYYNWVAHWTYKHDGYKMHQYSNKGVVDGINGNVDLDSIRDIKDFEIIKNLGFNNNDKNEEFIKILKKDFILIDDILNKYREGV